MAMLVLTAVMPTVRSATPFACLSRSGVRSSLYPKDAVKEGFRAVVALRIESDEAVNIVVVILPGRVEAKENRDFGDKFRSGSIFSIDRVDMPCGEICEQVTIYMVTV
jgi:hypothetical protein